MSWFFIVRSQRRFIFLAFALSILFLVYLVDRNDFLQILAAWGLAFGAYFYWLEKDWYKKSSRILTDSLVIRLLLLLAIPMLSDDYFRFIWDGHLALAGIDPFTVLPSEFVTDSAYLKEVYSGLNSKEYYSVYPPVMQWLFYAAAAIGGDNNVLQIAVMRLILIAADIGVIYFGQKILKALGKSPKAIAIYAFNPLIIVELVGNLHFEGLMIFFSVLAFYLLIKVAEMKNVLLAGLAFSLGVVTKLTNLLFLPPLLRRLGLPKTIAFGLAVLAGISLCFYPFVSEVLLANFSSSLDLYFRNFQFNASIYAVVMTLAKESIPHYTAQIVGPWISAAMVLIILSLAFFRKSKSWTDYFITLLFILTVHLFFSSTVHPWYLANLIIISVFTPYRFVVVWSMTIVLSYFMYGNKLYEVPWIVGLEYGLVIAYLLYELKSKKTLQPN